MSVNKFCSFLAFGVGLSMLSAFSDSARRLLMCLLIHWCWKYYIVVVDAVI